jgi:hypothetical protein
MLHRSIAAVQAGHESCECIRFSPGGQGARRALSKADLLYEGGARTLLLSVLCTYEHDSFLRFHVVFDERGWQVLVTLTTTRSCRVLCFLLELGALLIMDTLAIGPTCMPASIPFEVVESNIGISFKWRIKMSLELLHIRS